MIENTNVTVWYSIIDDKLAFKYAILADPGTSLDKLVFDFGSDVFGRLAVIGVPCPDPPCYGINSFDLPKGLNPIVVEDLFSVKIDGVELPANCVSFEQVDFDLVPEFQSLTNLEY